MTPEDVVDVLTKCAAYDQRTVGEVDVMAWHDVLARTDRADALEAVRLHYAEHTQRAMPADVRRLAAGIRDVRQGRERQQQRAIGAGPTVRDRSAEVTALVHTVATALPKPDLHQRAMDRARRERGRPDKPAPKQKKPRRPADHPPPATDDVARMATRYLVDGRTPQDVSERLYVSRRWCERTLARLRGA